MAVKNRYVCDNCEKLAFVDSCYRLPEDWSLVQHTYTEYEHGYMHKVTRTKDYHLCRGCTRRFKQLPFTKTK